MLTRKPRKGETLIYEHHDQITEYICAGAVDNSPSILRIINKKTEEPTTIIWRFTDSLNKLLTTKENK